MSRQLLVDTAERIFRDHCPREVLDSAEAGEFPAALWALLCDNGFHLLARSDSGFDLGDAFAFLIQAGRHAVPLPLAETLLANRWLGAEDTAVRSVSFGACDSQQDADVWQGLPWGRTATEAVSVSATGRILAARVKAPAALDQNLAGEPRDAVHLQDLRTLDVVPEAPGLLALSRVALVAGALTSTLALGVEYAGERCQFGRPIARFQAIQQQLAKAAGETAAAIRAADSAIEALGSDRFEFDLAAAKVRVGEAAGLVAEIVHQVHGAIGFTHEHRLHHFTRRLWAWREEYGGEQVWGARLGARICALGADHAWDFLATPA